jgi:hypothetical protein
MRQASSPNWRYGIGELWALYLLSPQPIGALSGLPVPRAPFVTLLTGVASADRRRGLRDGWDVGAEASPGCALPRVRIREHEQTGREHDTGRS